VEAILARISIVIPTLNRSESLRRLLVSIFCQTRVPEEVIVVDDSDNDYTSRLIRGNRDIFLNKGIRLKYFRGNEKNRSISAARNLGAAKSAGEIVLFIDDDVIIDNKYVEEVLKTYEEYPMAKGVQGYIVGRGIEPNFRTLLMNSMNKVFFLGYVEKDKCSVSRGLSYPYSPDKIIQCQWLHGSNMSLKKEMLQSFQFDENLKGFSMGEDVDLSSRIYKRYPNSLFMNPRAKVTHTPSPRTNRSMIYTNIAYGFYLLAKDYQQTISDIVPFFWGSLGHLILGIGLALFVSRDVKAAFTFVKAYVRSINHLSDIYKGDFRFLGGIDQTDNNSTRPLYI
jgi:glycosyltransferase involved in cell wall biosynthesis